MYIQNKQSAALPFSLPKGYSGNAFEGLKKAPNQPQAPIPPPIVPQGEEQGDPPILSQSEPPKDEFEGKATEDGRGSDTPNENTADAVSAFSEKGARDRHDQGLFSKLPFLSSLLPPPRKGHGGKNALPEWVILGIVLFLLLDTPENDLLPFLLLLLLWD